MFRRTFFIFADVFLILTEPARIAALDEGLQTVATFFAHTGAEALFQD